MSESAYEHFLIERELANRLREAPSKAERRRLYGPVYTESRQRIAQHPLVKHMHDDEARAARVEPQVRLVRSFLTPSSVVLEVGAGNGLVAKRVAPAVRRSIALDVTAELAVANDEKFEFVVFDGFNIPLPERSVDIAFSKDVIEHLHPEDALDHLREIRRVLADGGKYVCVTPNRLSGPHDISRAFVSGSPQGFHLAEYTSAELSTLMRKAGFSDVKVLLSYRGWRLSPLLPSTVTRRPERWLDLQPRARRVRFDQVLAAVKVIALR